MIRLICPTGKFSTHPPPSEVFRNFGKRIYSDFETFSSCSFVPCRNIEISSNISNKRDIQTPRTELKIRRAAENCSLNLLLG